MARAKPIAALRFSAKIETSVNWVTPRSTASAPRIAMPPTVSGTAAASAPPNTHTSTRKLIGIASDSIRNRSRWDCSVISRFTMASPPARTVTPSRSWTSRSDRSLAYS